ncbi:AKR1 [Symbiodinium sp. CCMP2592]|nr:AKR1 [Symbiodinium sp. CCMP2592]
MAGKIDVFEKAVQLGVQGDTDGLSHFLTEEREVLDHSNEDGKTLLYLLCAECTQDGAIPSRHGTPEQLNAVTAVLKARADPARATTTGMAPLHVAVMGDHLSLVRSLLDARANTAVGTLLDGRADNSGSPLALALFYAKAKICPEVVELLVQNSSVAPNLRTAAALGQPLDSFLDEKGLSKQALQGLGFYRPIPAFPEWPARLEWIAKQSGSEPVEVNKAVEQSVLDEALSWAARNNQVEAMVQLCKAGANVNSNAFRGTPLLWAIYSDSYEAAEWLLSNGADPNLRHDFGGAEHGKGAVAMHLAAQYSSLRCLRLLLERGALATIKDSAHGGTPVDWAQFLNAADSLELLAQYGHKPVEDATAST